MKPLRRARALKAQKSRSVVKTLPSPTGGWNARDAISDMPPTDASAMVNFFPQTTDVILRYGSASQGHLGTSAAGNAMLLDGMTGYATTPDSAPVSVSGDIDLRCYASLTNWSATTPQFFLSKDSSYQFFALNGFLGALIYSAAGATAAFLSDTVAPATDRLWVRFTCDIDNGAGFSVGTFYYSANGSTWTQLGTPRYQTSLATIKDTTAALELGRGDYTAGTTYYAPPVTVDAANFDGTNDYMARGAGLTGAVDGKTGILSAWLRFDGGVNYSILTGSTTLGGATLRFNFSRNGGQMTVNVQNSGGTAAVANILTAGGYGNGSSWWNFLFSWNAATGAKFAYTNDAADLSGLSLTTDVNAGYALADWAVGAFPSGVSKFNGCVAELYFAPGQYLDFSVTENRRKFITALGKPAFVGTDGSYPTGTAPLIYFHLADTEAPADFALNRATGGNFSITGVLTTASNSPSD